MARRKMPSVMKNRFSEVPAANIRRSVFDRSHGHKTTFDAGYLVPIFLDEVLPGDTFSMKHSFLCRMATPIFPLMDNLFLDIHYFFVPNRLLWTDWEEFCGYANNLGIARHDLEVPNAPVPNPNDPATFAAAELDPKTSAKGWPVARPYFVPWVAKTNSNTSEVQGSSTVQACSLADYLGIPVGLNFPEPNAGRNALPNGPFVNALPFLAYNQIYNEWYRDENLIPPLSQEALVAGSSVVTSGYGDISNFVTYRAETDSDTNSDRLNTLYQISTVGKLFKRGKRHDYFTSALPWPAKGPAVSLRLGGYAPVVGLGIMSRNNDIVPNYANTFGTTPNQQTYDSKGNAFARIPSGRKVMWSSADNGDTRLYIESGAVEPNGAVLPNIRADLTQVSGATINELRQAFQVQKLFERDARGGTRYIEILKSHFGVSSPDARLQRPEYLGGSSHPIHIAPVPQTSATASNSPQGNLSAYAVANGTKRCFTKSFVEHGYILGLASVRADLTYQQGLDRLWSRKGRFDFYWPTLAHLGEQAILNQEIYFNPSDTLDQTQNEDVFGYQERYAEYRYKNSLITGKMRATTASDQASDSYAAWHLGQYFSKLPQLNQSFIEENPPMERVLALGSNTRGAQFIFDGYFNLKCTRPMPVYSVPGLVDHF